MPISSIRSLSPDKSVEINQQIAQENERELKEMILTNEDLQDCDDGNIGRYTISFRRIHTS